MMEVTNESMEQVVKAVVILLRKESKKEVVEDSDQTNLTFLTCLQDSICNLLQQHNDQLCQFLFAFHTFNQIQTSSS